MSVPTELVVVRQKKRRWTFSRKPHVVRDFATLEEICERTGLPEERVRELVESGHMPHVLYDDMVLFPRGAVDKWVRTSYVQVFDGMPLPQRSTVFQATLSDSVPPLELCGIDGLEPAPKRTPLPAVYFLCRSTEVVYVGQSVDVFSRLCAHRDKNFDRAYYLPCPKSELRHQEAAYVAILKPEYNLQSNGKYRG